MTATMTMPQALMPTLPHMYAHLLRCKRDPLQTLAALIDNQGERALFRTGLYVNLLLSNPSDIREVLVSQSACFARGNIKEVLRLYLGNGLLTSDEPLHRQQRRTVQPVFQRKHVAAYCRLIAEEATSSIASWASGVPMDLTKTMTKLSLNVNIRLLLGSQLLDANYTRVAEALCTVMHSAANLSVGSLLVGALLERLPLPGVMRRRAAQACIATVLRRCLAVSDANEAAQGMLPPLIEAYRHASQDVVPTDTEQEIIVQATALLFAGADTVSAGLCWTWAMLAQHPAIAAQFYHEVDHVLAGRAPTVDDLPHLPFTSAIVREVLRLYPPVWLISRQAIADCQLGNFTIFKGTSVLISPWAVQRNPRLYERPLAFEPQRWLHEPRAHNATLAYMPFGAGPHTCMGQHLGMAELLLILVLTAQRWRVELDPTTVKPQAALTLRPLFPVPMRVYTR